MSAANSFNYLFLKRFAGLLHVFLPLSRLSLNVHQQYQEPLYTHPLILILLILVNEVGLQFVIYFVGLIPAQYYQQLGVRPDQRDFAKFRWLVLRSFGLVIVNACLKSLSTFLSSLLYVKWRTRLVVYLHSLYFTKQRYYHLLNTTQQNNPTHSHDQLSPTCSSHSIQTTDVSEYARESVDYVPTSSSSPLISKKVSIDNPDQRIAQDADSLCRSLSTIIPLLLLSPFIIAYYGYRTWEITGYYGPVAITIWFFVWTIINKIFISFVSRTIFRQNTVEGNFRFLHAQVRAHNEPIAFYHGGAFEHRRFDSYFTQALAPLLYRRTWQELLLSFSTNLFDYIGSIFSYMLLALVIFVFHLYDKTPQADLSALISSTSFIIMYLIYRFSMLNDLTDTATVIIANTHRVQTFVEYMKNIDTAWSDRQINRMVLDSEVLTIKNLSYSTPTNNGHLLMKDLNLTLSKGERLLITGDSGVGKTSLFRVLHSLWPANIHGSFSYRPTDAYLLPQRPYFTNLSVHDELSYPDVHILPTIERQRQIIDLLAQWNLRQILDHVESNVFQCPQYAWQDLLSPGELQRLSFIRLLLRLSPLNDQSSSRLTLVFLDEITSSLDVNMEMKMYRYLLAQNLTLISIGHRDTLREYHQYELKLFANGEYLLEPIERSSTI